MKIGKFFAYFSDLERLSTAALTIALACFMRASSASAVDDGVVGIGCPMDAAFAFAELTAQCDKYQKPDPAVLAIWNALDPSSIPANFQSSSARINEICNPFRSAPTCDMVKILTAQTGINFALIAANIAETPVPTGSMLYASNVIIPEIEGLKDSIGIAAERNAALEQEVATSEQKERGVSNGGRSNCSSVQCPACGG